MNHLELQQQVQRFAGEFISRITSACEPIAENAERTQLRDMAVKRVLQYSSAALDIASGPSPEVNLLDMAVFVRLSRSVYKRHFAPRFGETGAPIQSALAMSEKEIWALAATMLEPREYGELGNLTDAWLDKHRDIVNVEIVRFREFAEHVGELISGFDQQASGLFRRIKGATQTADHAVLLGERALFLAQRMPTLIRLQVRVGAQSVIRDSAMRLKDATRGWPSLAGVVGYALLGVTGAAALWGGYRLMTRPGGRRFR